MAKGENKVNSEVRRIVEESGRLPVCELTDLFHSAFAYVGKSCTIYEFIERVCEEHGIAGKSKEDILAIVNVLRGGDIDWHDAWLFVKPKMYIDLARVLDGIKETGWWVHDFVRVNDESYIVVRVRSKLDAFGKDFSELDKAIKVKKPRVIADDTIITGFVVKDVNVNVLKYDPNLPPPEDRIYIKPEDLKKLPKNIKVYRGERGGLFISRTELKQLLEEEGKEEDVDQYLREHGVRWQRQTTLGEYKEEEREEEFSVEEYMRRVEENLKELEKYKDKIRNFDEFTKVVKANHEKIARAFNEFGVDNSITFEQVDLFIERLRRSEWDLSDLDRKEMTEVVGKCLRPIIDEYMRFINANIGVGSKEKEFFERIKDYIGRIGEYADVVKEYKFAIACLYGLSEYLTYNKKAFVIEVDEDTYVSVDLDVLDKFASEYNIPIFSLSRCITNIIRDSIETESPALVGREITKTINEMRDGIKMPCKEVFYCLYGIRNTDKIENLLNDLAVRTFDKGGFDWWREEGRRKFSMEFEFEGLNVLKINNFAKIAEQCKFYHDGSLSGFDGELNLSFLSGEKGYEFIERFFRECREAGLVNTDKAGLHISVDASDIKDKFDERGKLALHVAWWKIANELFDMGILDESRIDNIYCVTFAEMDIDRIIDYLKGEISFDDLIDENYLVGDALEDKYWAVAYHTLNNLGRIEFRQPDGMWINGKRERLLAKICVGLIDDFAKDKEKFIEKIINDRVAISDYLTPEEVEELRKIGEELATKMREREYLIRALQYSKTAILDKRRNKIIKVGFGERKVEDVKGKKIVDYAKKKSLKKGNDIVWKILKTLGVMSTSDSAIMNPTYGGKRKKKEVVGQINEEANVFGKSDLWFTTIVNEEDFEILKRGFTLAIKRYAKGDRMNALLDTNFWQDYAGLSKEECKKINEILMKCVLDGSYLHKDIVIDRLVKDVGIDKSRAELIATTELSNLANKVREIAYMEKTKVQKFKWITENDDKVCEKCKRLAELTARGVTLDELKRLIKEIGGNTAREFVVHPGCRCSFIRYREDNRYMRWWE